MAWLYLSNPCAFLLPIAHGAAGAAGARLSLRPLSKEGATKSQSSGESAPRECGRLFEKWISKSQTSSRRRPGPI